MAYDAVCPEEAEAGIREKRRLTIIYSPRWRSSGVIVALNEAIVVNALRRDVRYAEGRFQAVRQRRTDGIALIARIGRSSR
jgi:hypothetical protein